MKNKEQEPLTTYTVKGRNLPIVLEFKYDLNGFLKHFENLSEPLGEKTQKWLFEGSRFPYKEATIKSWRGVRNIELIVGVPDLNFDTFYNLYKHKVGKLEAQRAWKKLNKADQLLAIQKIKDYNGYLQRKRIAKANPATYLNKRRFEDDFNSIH